MMFPVGPYLMTNPPFDPDDTGTTWPVSDEESEPIQDPIDHDALSTPIAVEHT